MWVFIKGIPKEMDSKGLEKIIKKLLRPAWSPFFIRGHIGLSGTKILKIVHTRTRRVEYHGLIRVKPEDKTDRVIKRLNQSVANGRKLESHIYCKRNTRRDRRKMLLDNHNDSNERRRVERRRMNLVSQVIDATH
jgi:hypothetical protein